MLTLVNSIYTVDAPKEKKENVTPTRSIVRDYTQVLESVAEEVEKIIKRYFNRFTSKAAARAVQYLGKYSSRLREWAQKIAFVVVLNIDKESRGRWSSILERMPPTMRGQINQASIRPLIEQFLRDNVELITSMPLQAADRVQDLVLVEALGKGARSVDLEEEIMRIGDITRNRAKLIARTEVSRMTTGLTMARAKSVGSNWYIWRTAGDAIVRDSHKNLEGVLVNWDEPPSPEKLIGQKVYGNYHAACTFNCRCHPEPVVDWKEMRFPVKVYSHGMIRRMSREEFSLIAGEIYKG